MRVRVPTALYMTFGNTFSKEGEITGEHTALRYSMYDTWLKSKDSYRKKYYYGIGFATPETVFGHTMHKVMEKKSTWKKHPILKDVMRYEVPEKNITVNITPDIKIGGRLDSFDPTICTFLDYKFSHRDKNGKAPWDAVKVQRHRQMVFYSILIEKKFQRVDRWTRLIWIETAFKKKHTEFAGHTLETDAIDLELTGEFTVFKRMVSKWEREAMEESIIKVAQEINQDYQAWKQKTSKE